MKVKVKKLHNDAVIPKYQTKGASGFDFHALEDTVIFNGDTKLVRTGLAFEIPLGYELQVRPRSGTSLKTKLRVANSPGTVDADYRGEVCIIVDNLEPRENLIIKKGERIAQGVICPVFQADLVVVENLSESERNNGAFGSTGK
jgi:dUTP pyrophosphatase